MKKNLLTLALIFLYAISSYAQAPTITSFSPASGPVGTLVTITGTNLSNPTAFTIGGVAATKVSGTATTLVGMVMPGAATGSVSVTTAGGTAMGGINFTITPTVHPASQLGSKLLGTGAIGSYVSQGRSVAISAAGNTAIVGGDYDSSGVGAAWIYTRSGTTWVQQGPKLIGTGAVGLAGQGRSVAISADGNTAIVGGPEDSTHFGAAWVFQRMGSTWAQQGSKLVGAGTIGSYVRQGFSVAISADGNTAIVGGINDNNNNNIGAAWIYTRSGATWTQQGSKLVGTGDVGGAEQGSAVAISADGNTAIVGGWADNNYLGAAWVYTRSGAAWTQQGSKLVGTGAVNSGLVNFVYYGVYQGWSVAISANGNTAIVGGWCDSTGFGAAWVFTRSGAAWTQQGHKIVGTGAIGSGAVGSAVSQDSSVAISAEGNTAIVGGYDDDNVIGATWVYTRSGSTWIQQGHKIVGSGAAGQSQQGYSVALSADGNTAIVGGPVDSSNLGAAWAFGSDSSRCTQTASTLSHSICSGQSYGGHTTAGIYHDTLTSAGGCDSIVTLTLSINSTLTSSFSHSICSGNSYTFGGHTLTTAGTYHDTLTSSGGCDSVITLTLTVNPLPSQPHITRSGTTLSVSTIGHLQWFYNGLPQSGDTTNSITVTQNGSYTMEVTDANGCSRFSDTMQVAHLSIGEINTTSSIRLHPNPTTESFTLSVNAEMIGTSYTFSDITGRIIHSYLIEKESTLISFDGLSSGIYILQIEGRSYKVVKE